MPTLGPMSLDPRTDTVPPQGAGDASVGSRQGPPTAQISAPVVGPVASPPPGAAPVVSDPTPADPRTAETSAPVAGAGRSRSRIEARQVQRILTRIDPWSVLKVSLLLAVSLWLILVVAGVVLWRVAVATGTIGKFENFVAQLLAEDSFVIDGMQILRGSVIAGLVLVVTGAVLAVTFSVLFNLIAGLTGGVRATVIELETARRADRGRSRR